jgi:hypothetical protein
MDTLSRTPTVAMPGTAQTLAWASSYYLPAILAVPMARDLGLALPTVFGAFSAALPVSAAIGPYAGRAIDRWGGRPVLAATSVVTGITLIAGFASTVGWPLSAWLETEFGRRGACLAWAALHLLVGLPLNALLPRAATAHASPPAANEQTRAGPAAVIEAGR